MTKPPMWSPVLQGEAAARADEAIDAIAEALRPVSPVASLGSGSAGVALLFAYLGHTRRDEAAWRAADEQIDASIEAVGSTPMRPDLYGGFTGIAWATEHVERLRGEAPEEDANEEIDGELLELLGQTPWTRDYDLISGLVGYGVYALERWPRPAAAACLERVVDRLGELAEERDGRVTWLTRPELLIPETREDFPKGYYNLGVAHGVPGVVALLGSAVARGIPSAAPLLEGAVTWLLSQRLPEGAGSAFGHWVAPGEFPRKSRLAWCYGDAGIAASLFVAGRAAGRPEWARAGIDLALEAAGRPPEAAGVVDAPLCHGSAGLGLIFQRLFVASGEARLGEASRLWFERTLAMRRPGEGIGGYRAWQPIGGPGELGWGDSPNLLSGSAGIALALLAATTTVEPAWDRVLLLSEPPGE